jgi:hypothetical protein
MVAFNGFEAPIYFARTILGYGCPGDLKDMVSRRDEVYKIAMQMYDYSLAHCRDDKSAGIAGRPGYEAIARKHRWDLAVQTGRGEDVLEDMKAAMGEAPTREIRSYAAERTAQHYYRNGNYRKSARVLADWATGRVHGRCSTYGLHKLRRTAENVDDPAITHLVRTTAEEMLRKHKDILASRSVFQRVKRLATYTPQQHGKEQTQ